MSAAEVAQGTRYTEALKTTWRPPKYYRDMTDDECDKLRAKWSILVDVSDAESDAEPCLVGKNVHTRFLSLLVVIHGTFTPGSL